MMISLIDGDVLMYSCGYAAEKVTYKVTDEQGKEFSFKSKKDLKKWEDTIEDYVDYTEEKLIEIQPESFALSNTKNLIEHIFEITKATDYRIYITGRNNFRHKIAKTKPYKGHRDEDIKPVHYGAIKDYLLDVWCAEIVDGMEADDAMGIMQIKHYDFSEDNGNSCICTVDKDLDQIPGWHYNWKKDKVYMVKPEAAVKFCYKQLLMGDITDNIQGIPGIGEKTADKILQNIDTQDLYKTVLEQYCNYFGDAGVEKFHEMGLLTEILWYKEDLKQALTLAKTMGLLNKNNNVNEIKLN